MQLGIKLRGKGDYLILEEVSDEEAEKALECAQLIIEAVHIDYPTIFNF